MKIEIGIIVKGVWQSTIQILLSDSDVNITVSTGSILITKQ